MKRTATPTEPVVLGLTCDGHELLRLANRLLKSKGLRLKEWRAYKGDCRDDDQRYLSLESLTSVPPRRYRRASDPEDGYTG